MRGVFSFQPDLSPHMESASSLIASTKLAQLSCRRRGYFSRGSVLFLARAFVATGMLLIVLSLVTAEKNRTIFGTPLGPDFTAMYVAGSILNDCGPRDLYNLDLQQQFRRHILPGTPDWDTLPFLYAPWFATLWRPLASLPYHWAYCAWAVVNPMIFLGGFWLLSRTCPRISQTDMRLAALVSLSSAPFLFESWANGQVAAIPFFAICLSLLLHKRECPFLGGMVLALCLYKPTQPMLIVLMLLLGRRWRSLAGLLCGGCGLAAVTWLVGGFEILIAYPRMLLQFRNGLATKDIIITRAKYVDVRSASQLLSEPWSTAALVCLGAIALLIAVRLAVAWRRAPAGWNPDSQHAWAATLIAAPVVSAYFAGYDAILVIPGFLLAFDLWQDATANGEERCNPLVSLAALVYLGGMLVPANEVLRVNLMTLALLYVAWRIADRRTAGLEPAIVPVSMPVVPAIG